MSVIDFEQEDWIDIERKSPGQVQRDEACIRVSQWKGSHRPTVYVTLRGELREWAVKVGPAFSAQVGGQHLNYVRLSPTDSTKAFRATSSKNSLSSLFICLGVIDVWPVEPRASIGIKTERDRRGNLVLILPNDWAKPSDKKPAPPRAAPPVQKPAPAPTKPNAIPITTRAQGLEMAGKIAASRAVPAHNFGDPPRGRSALDHRQIEFPESLGSIRFQSQERIMCGMLLSHEKVAASSFLAATATPGIRDDRGKEIAGTVVSNLRRKFTALGIEISNDPGIGYFMSERTKAALQRLVDGAR
jgi:hypothetical protein